MNLAMLLTFQLLGFGWDGEGILTVSGSQSPKLVAVWTELEPLPLVVNNPVPVIFGMIFFWIIHAYVFGWISPA